VAVPAGAGPGATPSVSIVGIVSRAHAFPGMADVQYGGSDPRPPAARAGGVGAAGEPASSCLPSEPLLAVPPAFFRGDLPPADAGALPRGGGDRGARGGPPAVPFHAAHVPAPDEGGGGGGRRGAPAGHAAAEAALGAAPVRAPAAFAPAAAAALARSVYTFKTGPWAGLWIRRGYDPRADPAAAAWQAVPVGRRARHAVEPPAPAAAAPVDYGAVCSFSAPPPAGGLLAVAADLAAAVPEVAAALAAPRAAAADPVSGWVAAAAWDAALIAVRERAGG